MKNLINVFLALALAVLAPAHAQQSRADYPNKPVKILVPFAPGGATDYAARLMAEHLSKRMGQPFVVDNRTGAGGIIAIDAVAKAPADGYTLLVASASYAVNPAVMKLPFDPVRDLEPVVNICFGPLGVIVHPDLPVKNLKELVTYAKANPGKLVYASAGIGNTTHISMEAFLAETGTKMIHSPYKGMAPALADLAGGQAQVIMSDVGSAQGLVQAGRLRMLAIGGKTRFAQIPDVPTVGEAGFPNILAGSWQGMFAPRDTPPAIVAELNRHVNEIIRMKEVIDQLASRFATPVGGTPADFAATVKSDINKFGAVARNANIKVE